MEKTIRQLAEELNVSKQAIQKRINGIPYFRDKYLNKVGNKFVINDDGLRVLYHKIKQEKSATIDNHSNKNANQNNSDISAIIDILKQQINNQNELITKQVGEIDNLHHLLENAQKLQLLTLQENKELKQQLKQLNDSSSKSVTNDSTTTNNQNDNQATTEQSQNKKWWQFWK